MEAAGDHEVPSGPLAVRWLAYELPAVRAGALAAPRVALENLDEPAVAEEDAEAIAYLAPGCVPAADWSRLVLDAHAEGYAAVGGSIDAAGGLLHRAPRSLAPWSPGSGRNPGFAHPLLCPSVVLEFEPEWAAAVEGLPALRPPAAEPWLYDGRIEIRARP